MTSPPGSVGVVGAGLMGAGMTGRLLDAGYGVRVVAHRNRAPVEALVARGATEEPDIANLAAATDALLLCLPNADVVDRVMETVLPRLRKGGLVIDTSTSLPATSRGWSERLRETGAGFVDAPVTGGPSDAAAGTLRSMVGAEDGDFERVRPLLACWSAETIRFGGPGTGHAAKLINNFITMTHIATTIEAMRRCDRQGIDREAMFRVLSKGAASSGILMKFMPGVFAGDPDAYPFALENAAKDVRYAREVARDAGEESPILGALQAFFESELERWPPEVFVSRLVGPPPEN